MSDPRRVILSNVRLSYLHVFEPKAFKEGQDLKYSVSMIIPKEDEELIEEIEAAIEAAIEHAVENRKEWKGKRPKEITNPLQDGDDRDDEDEAYEGCMYLNASNKMQPEVVDEQCKPIMDRRQFKSGDYGNVVVNFFGYGEGKKAGVSAQLGPLQKTKDGPALGGSIGSAKDYFKPIKGAKKSNMLD